jgi:hypothetical protein
MRPEILGFLVNNIYSEPNTPPYYFIVTAAGGLINVSKTELPTSLQSTYPTYTSSLLSPLTPDGLSDLVLGSENAATNTSEVFLNPGDGDFAAVTPIALPAPSQSLMGAPGLVTLDIQPIHISSENYNDLVVVSTDGQYQGWTIQILINDGAGHFTDQTSTRLNAQSYATASSVTGGSWVMRTFVSDIRGDGAADIVVEGNLQAPNEVLVNNGEGYFSQGYVAPADEQILGLCTLSDGVNLIEWKANVFSFTPINVAYLDPGASSIAATVANRLYLYGDGAHASQASSLADTYQATLSITIHGLYTPGVQHSATVNVNGVDVGTQYLSDVYGFTYQGQEFTNDQILTFDLPNANAIHSLTLTQDVNAQEYVVSASIDGINLATSNAWQSNVDAIDASAWNESLNPLVGTAADPIQATGTGPDVWANVLGTPDDYTITGFGASTLTLSESAGLDQNAVIKGAEYVRFQDGEILRTANGVISAPTEQDFNNDGRSDILFSDPYGKLSTADVIGATVVGGGALGRRGAGWSYVATGDFGHDGAAGLLFQDSSGDIADWLIGDDAVNGGGVIGAPGGTWSVVGVGDFEGPGGADILFRDAQGDYAFWTIEGAALVSGGGIGNPGAGWTFKGLGDFNGDGKSDLLFENTAGTYATWLMNGAKIVGGAALGAPGAGWVFKGIGDFNGDGTSDILFENVVSGEYASWDIKNDGISGGGFIGAPGPALALKGIGDYNGDGKSDLLFQNLATGGYTVWDLDDYTVIGEGQIATASAPLGVARGLPATAAELPATLIFQDASGVVASWTTNGVGLTGGAVFGNPGAGWSAVGVGDFTGADQVDILFENASGTLATWQTSGAELAGGGTVGSPGGTWKFVGLGDFNGDGVSDLLFVDASGDYATWNLEGTRVVGGGTLGDPGAGDTLVAVADFNGDGQSDLLFRDASGNYAIWFVSLNRVVGGAALGNPGADFVFMGTGDFNGDGRADILFRNSVTGAYADWLVNGSALVGGGNIGNPGAGYAFAGVADLNGDHRADILFKSAAGYATWEMNGAAIIGGGSLGHPGGTFQLVGAV